MIKLNTVQKVSSSQVGGKGLNLIKLSSAGFKVPEGFVVSTDYFFAETDSIKKEISGLLSKLKPSNIEQTSKRIEDLFLNLKLSDEFQKALFKEFQALRCERVAVRSSAASEDGSGASWAGQLETKLNVKEGDLVSALKSCWASAYGVRALQYAQTNSFKLSEISVAVVIQRMIQSDISGVAFSVNPVTKNKDQILIEAVYGLGEAIVSGSITPDEYIIDANNFNIIERAQENQTRQLSLRGYATTWVEVPPELKTKLKLSDVQLKNLATTVDDIAKKMGYAADIEWAMEGGILYITQSRPITTLSSEGSAPARIFAEGSDLFRWGPTNARYFFIGDFIENCFDFFGTEMNRTYAVFSEDKMVWISDNKLFREFCQHQFEKLLNNPDVIKLNSDKFLETIKKIDKFYYGAEAPSSSLEEAVEGLRKIRDLAREFWAPTFIGEMANYGSESYIEKNLDPDNQYSTRQKLKIMEVMSTPEQASFLQTMTYKLRRASAGDLAKIAEQYAWVENGYSGIKILSKDYFAKLKLSVEGQGDIADNDWLARAKANKAKLVKELKLSKDILEQFNLLTSLIIEQDTRKMYMMKLQKIKYDHLKQLISFSDFGLNDIDTALDYSLNEIIQMVESGSGIKPKNSNFGYSNSGGQVSELDQAESYSIWYHYGSEKTMTYGKIISGSTASYGVQSKVKAKARVVEDFNSEEANNFEQGEVLITVMTTPEYLSLMKKASAIVTDVGGLTSHAAIVARELGKPCIVGTKVATRIIKTGDEVFVDTHTATVSLMN